MATTDEQPAVGAGHLPSELKEHLWRRLDRRLRNGDVLITNEQFFVLMVREFRRAVGIAPDRRTKVALLNMIIRVNEKHPETYLSAGIGNAVKAFLRNTGEDDSEAREMIKRMVKEGRTAMWLESMGIDVDARTLSGWVEQAIIRVVDGKRLNAPPRRETRRRRPRPTASMAGVSRTSLSDSVPKEESPASAYGGAPTEAEERERTATEAQHSEELAAEELRRAPRNLEAYRQQKLLTDEEAQELRKLHSIDQRLADGDIDAAEARRLRGEISESVRARLQERLREAVDHSVHYLSVFEALRRIPADRDPALALLLRFPQQVMAEDPEAVDLAPVTEILKQDDGLLDELGTLMERKDHELRMMAANMPPYRHVYTPEQSLGKFTAVPEFVELLRTADRAEISGRLNDEEPQQRVRAAADIKCVVALLTTMMKTTTPFHREVRRLRIGLRMQHLFDGSVDERDGRNRVQQFLRRRLHSLYPDLGRQERAAIEEVGQQIMEGRGRGGADAEDNTKRVYRV